MKKLVIKLFICIITMFSFTGCYTLSKMYKLKEDPLSNNTCYKEYIYIYIYMLIKKNKVIKIVLLL